MLSPQLLELLRQWRAGRRHGVILPQGWLFPGMNRLEPLSTRQLRGAVHEAVNGWSASSAIRTWRRPESG